MASARGKSRRAGKAAKPGSPSDALPMAKVVPTRREIAAKQRRRGQIELAAGAALLVGGTVVAMTGDATALAMERILAVFAMWAIGLAGIAGGAAHLDPRVGATARADTRRWIYGVLAVVFAVIYAFCMWKVIPNKLPSAFFHLATAPLFTLAMAIGTLMGNRYGWWLGVFGGSLLLLSIIILVARILASAAFLAGVYGAFGKAASTFSLVSVALIVEVVGILPICQVKFLMSRAGRRAYGV